MKTTQKTNVNTFEIKKFSCQNPKKYCEIKKSKNPKKSKGLNKKNSKICELKKFSIKKSNVNTFEI